MVKEEVYNVLKTGNFYLPVLHKNEKFIVLNTIDFELDKSKNKQIEHFLKNKMLHFKFLADLFYDKIQELIKEDKTYKNCWFVPIKMDCFDEQWTMSVDILKPVK